MAGDNINFRELRSRVNLASKEEFRNEDESHHRVRTVSGLFHAVDAERRDARAVKAFPRYR
jgi:hypothetical protein